MATVSPKDWRYFEFQLWQEGAARWTETQVSLRSSDQALLKSALNRLTRTMLGLDTLDLASMRREVVYPVGAAELFLLDRCHGHWQEDYFSAPTLGHLFDGVTEQACK